MNRARTTLVWFALVLVVGAALFAAATSPLLAWREPIYITAGFAGVLALALLLIQPLLAGRFLPGLSAVQARIVHRWIGSILVLVVIVHVGGLWITSPPDVVDALLFVSATPFSAWGVMAMWALFAAALLALFRRRLRLTFKRWRVAHLTLAVITVIGSVVHALMIEGTMELFSKVALCALVGIVTARLVWNLRSSVR